MRIVTLLAVILVIETTFVSAQNTYSLDSTYHLYYGSPFGGTDSTKSYVVEKDEAGQALTKESYIHSPQSGWSWNNLQLRTYFENGDLASFKNISKITLNSIDSFYVGYHAKLNLFGEIIWLSKKPLGLFGTPDSFYIKEILYRLDTTEIHVSGRPLYRPKYDLLNNKELLGYNEYIRTNGQLDTLRQFQVINGDSAMLRWTHAYEYDLEGKLILTKTLSPHYRPDTASVSIFEYAERYMKESNGTLDLITDELFIGVETQTYYLDDKNIDSIEVHVWNSQTQSWDISGKTKHYYSLHTISSINSLKQHYDITIFPNPVDELLHVSSHNSFLNKVNVKILSLQGSLVFQQWLTSVEKLDINTGHLSHGIYFLSINDSPWKKFTVAHR